MTRQDIWQDGIKTRFSPDNQPANRGAKEPTQPRHYCPVSICLLCQLSAGG
ncbi:hypothetical protein [Spirosoma luteum]|uniref:hypothetical protein n=1 Tax=Spirosoma luteum TaxID=431553 RepID=UPI0012FAD34F|nr:hypothetical protein [Spirosoma luteum]